MSRIRSRPLRDKRRHDAGGQALADPPAPAVDPGHQRPLGAAELPGRGLVVEALEIHELDRAAEGLGHRREGVADVAKLAETPQLRGEAGGQRLLLSVARPAQLERLFAKLFDESEFLSPHGLRALSGAGTQPFIYFQF